jgi:hypothetical protein
MASDTKFIIVLFISLLMGGLISIFELASEPQRWRSMDQHVATVHAMIEIPLKLDVAFFGSSRTMNGVDAGLIESELEKAAQRVEVRNLGVNWFGHGIHASMLEACLEKHDLALAVVEIPLLYRFKPHPHLLFHASPGVVEDVVIKNIYTWPTFLTQGPRRVLQSFIPTEYWSSADHSRMAHHGMLEIEQSRQEEERSLEEANFRLQKLNTDLTIDSNWKASIQRARYKLHLDGIINFCKQSKNQEVKAIGLVLPKCGFSGMNVHLKQEYAKHLELWIPPDELLQRPELWRDFGHLNSKGASILGHWLSNKIQEELERL